MTPSVSHSALYCRRETQSLIGNTGVHVDDSLYCGSNTLLSLWGKTLQKLDSCKWTLHNLNFSGLKMLTTPSGVTIHQQPYIDTLQLLYPSSPFSEYCSLHPKLSRETHTLPDISYGVALPSRTTTYNFNADSVKALNKSEKHIRSKRNIQLQFPPLKSS